jgi:hypothetical protein
MPFPDERADAERDEERSCGSVHGHSVHPAGMPLALSFFSAFSIACESALRMLRV